MLSYSAKRGWLYGLAAFFTTLSDEIVPILREQRWPSGQEAAASLIIGGLSVVLILRAFIDGSVARKKTDPTPEQPNPQ